jgi:hypothetical protein
MHTPRRQPILVHTTRSLNSPGWHLELRVLLVAKIHAWLFIRCSDIRCSAEHNHHREHGGVSPLRPRLLAAGRGVGRFQALGVGRAAPRLPRSETHALVRALQTPTDANGACTRVLRLREDIARTLTVWDTDSVGQPHTAARQRPFTLPDERRVVVLWMPRPFFKFFAQI